MKDLQTVIEYLQKNDKDGSYTDISKEIKCGELTIQEGRNECSRILEGWLIEDVENTEVKKMLSLSLTDEGVEQRK